LKGNFEEPVAVLFMGALPFLFDIDEDGTQTGKFLDRQAQADRDDEAAEREARLRDELAAEKRRRAEEVAEARRKADDAALLASIRSLGAPSALAALSEPEEPFVDHFAMRQAEENRLRAIVRKAINEELEGDDMDDDNAPAPAARKSTGGLIADPKITKPNGHGAPAAASTDNPQGMSMGVKWGLAALTLGAIVAAIVRFPLTTFCLFECGRM
jgi:hypothetical protein